MQGSHIWHMAEQSEIGERLTLVTSFYVDDPFVYDSSSMQGLTFVDASTIKDYVTHVLKRLMNKNNIQWQMLSQHQEALEVCSKRLIHDLQHPALALRDVSMRYEY